MTTEEEKSQGSRSQNGANEDDVSFDEDSFSTQELSFNDTTQEVNKPSTRRHGKIIQGVSFSDGIDRIKSHWRVLAAGQLISFLIATTGAMSSSLYYECNISMPSTQAILVFAFMGLHMFNLINRKFQKRRGSPRKKSSSSKSKRRFFYFGAKDAKDNKATGDGGDDNKPGDLALGQSVSLDSQDLRREMHDSSNKNTNSADPSTLTPHSLFGIINLHAPLWAYFIIAVISVQATTFASYAMRYTSLMSASVLDNSNIFAAIIGSRMILKRRYSFFHLLGALICFIGVLLNIIADYKRDLIDPRSLDDAYAELESDEYPDRVIGDILAILGGIFFGLSDVVIEVLVKNFGGAHEYLGCVGLFGTFVAIVQAALFERASISKFVSIDEISIEEFENFDNPDEAPRTCSQMNALALLIGAGLAGYLSIALITRFLTVSEAALLTISTLSADLWAVLFTIFAQHIVPSTLFYFAFVLSILGVVVYEMSPSPLGPAEDLRIHKEIELESNMNINMFEISNVSMSWDSQQSRGSQQRREIV
mmetsp:Transcript_18456/g.27679  ORF Transcript_18456/g.27679 Transcript_18456/m.27679 type:complete len:536 (-) Transcript_18456:2056-3663(-)